jgi:RND family efflux transporter MFP subunit
MKSTQLPGVIAAWAAAGALVLGASRSARGAPDEPDNGLPIVAVASVTRQDLYQPLTIQAEFRPYQEVELHTKVAGYLQSIDVDFGDRVKAGDLIAVLEIPELQDELDQARAAQRRATADYHNAHLDYTRLMGVNRSQPNLVDQQDLDAAEARDLTAAATLSGAKADVEKYQTLFGYTRITAPFDGVVTARYADPGALMQASAASPALIRLSENQLLRLDFPVSESYAQDIAVGDPVQIQWDSSNRGLEAKITRFTRRISMETRTMETEVEVPNPDLKLIPGMYATVVLKLNRRPGALAVPVEAVSDVAHPTVYLVDADGQIEERGIRLGLETPSSYEVLSGLREGDLVMIGSRARVHPGEKVQPKIVPKVPVP